MNEIEMRFRNVPLYFDPVRQEKRFMQEEYAAYLPFSDGKPARKTSAGRAWAVGLALAFAAAFSLAQVLPV